MKLAKSTYVKIGLILLLCLLVCGWLGGCLRTNRAWDEWGSPWWPLGGVVGCMAFEPVSSAVDDVVVSSDEDDGPGRTHADAWGQGSFEVDATSISAIELNWLAGKVNVRVVPDEETSGAIRATETLSGRTPQMQWELSSGGVLTINYMDGMRGFSGLSGCSNATMGSKELELLIPDSMQADLQRFELEAASGEYAIDGADRGTLCSTLELGVASGSVYVNDVVVDVLEASLASGRISFGGDVTQTLSIDQASGELTFGGCSAPPADITGSLASGRIVLELPAATALTPQVEKTSGSFRNDFDGAQNGKGAPCNLEFEILSGSLEVVAV